VDEPVAVPVAVFMVVVMSLVGVVVPALARVVGLVVPMLVRVVGVVMPMLVRVVIVVMPMLVRVVIVGVLGPGRRVAHRHLGPRTRLGTPGGDAALRSGDGMTGLGGAIKLTGARYLSMPSGRHANMCSCVGEV
ncbi:MAG: hypothetical protein ACRDMZ_20590, partial [Solirubrobacteraceae bacterium]